MRLRAIVLSFLLASPALAQQISAWSATTGDVVLSGAATAATIQQPAKLGRLVYLDQVQVYCSAACTVTQTANGTVATATAGTITPILPGQLNMPIPLSFFTASNSGSGTVQGGITHIGAGATAILCLAPSCGNAMQVALPSGIPSANYTVSIASITGTVNITFFGRIQ